MHNLEPQNITNDDFAAIELDPKHWLYHTRIWHDFLNHTFGWTVKGITHREGFDILFHLPVVTKLTLSLKKRAVSLPLSHFVNYLGRNSEVLVKELPYGIKVHAELPGLQDNNRVITYLDLSRFESEDEILEAFHKSHIVRKIRRAQRENYSVAIATDYATIDRFWELQAETRRRQGSPTFPRNFFRNMRDTLGDVFRLHAVSRDGKLVAGVVFLTYGGKSLYGYGASIDDRNVWKDGVNQLAMWDAIRVSWQDGISVVDFGTSPKGLPELAAYKARWGGKSETQIYTITSPENSMCVSSARDGAAMKFASRILKSTPQPIYNRISPTLLKLSAD